MRSLATALGVCVAGLSCACAADAIPRTGTNSSDTNIVIGLLLPPDESASSSIKQAVQLAVQHANETNPIPTQLVVGGRAGQWGTDGDEAVRLVTEHGAQALIAPPGGAPSHLALQVAGRTAIPVVSLSGDSSVTGTGVPWMLRLTPGTREEVRFLLRASKLAAGSKWIALVPEGRPGQQVKRDLEHVFEETQFTLEQTIAIGGKTNLLKVIPSAALKVAGVLLWLDPGTAAHVTPALRKAGFSGLLAGPGRLNSAGFLETAGSAADGVMIAGIQTDDTSRALKGMFAAAYRERYHTAPDNMAGFGYDAGCLLIKLLHQSIGASPHRAFPLTGTRPGVSGPLSFAADGSRVCVLEVLVCTNGVFKP